MKKDITNRQDIETLINSFYDIVKANDKIGYIFITVIGSDWSHHLPVMYRFWESVLFNQGGYLGNPIKKHIDIDHRIPLTKEHFDTWLTIWYKTVDHLFEGEIASMAKNKAMLMANLISMKVEMAKDDKFIQ